MSRTMLSCTILGHRVTLTVRARTPERRAGSWAGVGPARNADLAAPASSSTAIVRVDDHRGVVHLDVPPGRPAGDLVGVAAHAGPWLALLTWLPTPALCVCGHDRDAHQHYRPGSDCGTCGPEVCAALNVTGQETARA